MRILDLFNWFNYLAPCDMQNFCDSMLLILSRCRLILMSHFLHFGLTLFKLLISLCREVMPLFCVLEVSCVWSYLRNVKLSKSNLKPVLIPRLGALRQLVTSSFRSNSSSIKSNTFQHSYSRLECYQSYAAFILFLSLFSPRRPSGVWLPRLPSSFSRSANFSAYFCESWV